MSPVRKASVAVTSFENAVISRLLVASGAVPLLGRDGAGGCGERERVVADLRRRETVRDDAPRSGGGESESDPRVGVRRGDVVVLGDRLLIRIDQDEIRVERARAQLDRDAVTGDAGELVDVVVARIGGC